MEPLRVRLDMTHAATLANLAPDIIRAIIPMVGLPVETLRLISPIWNTIVLEFLSHPENLPPLRKVYFDREVTYGKRVIMCVAWAAKYDEHFRPYFRGWQTNRFNEVCSPPLHLNIDGNVSVIVFSLIFLLILAIFGTISIHYSCLLVIIVPLIGWAAYRWLYVKPRMMRHLNGLRRIFSRCSAIDNVSLDEIDWRVATTIRETIKDIPLKKLIIRREYFFQMYDVECWVHTHEIEYITVITANISETMESMDFQRLFRTVIRSEIRRFELWEHVSTVGLILGRQGEFWDKLAADLSCDEFTIHLVDGSRWRLGSELHRFSVTPT